MSLKTLQWIAIMIYNLKFQKVFLILLLTWTFTNMYSVVFLTFSLLKEKENKGKQHCCKYFFYFVFLWYLTTHIYGTAKNNWPTMYYKKLRNRWTITVNLTFILVQCFGTTTYLKHWTSYIEGTIQLLWSVSVFFSLHTVITACCATECKIKVWDLCK